MYFKDSTFGVKPDQIERIYSPRDDVTIVRDKAFGVPHIYGKTRAGAMFGAGYAGAEDRLFFMDVLRHAGRGELSSFAGGANQAQDAEQWAVAPYTEADLDKQAADLPRYLGAQGSQIVADVDEYLAGVNQYIAEAKLDPTKMPGEYAAIGRPLGPDPFKPSDLIATAAMVGGIFGKGGGEELEFSQLADALEQRFGTALRRQGVRELPLGRGSRGAGDGLQAALPLRGAAEARARRRAPRSRLLQGFAAATSGGLLGFPLRASNALLVSAKHSKSGHPLMVAGPQVGYFNPQILMEEDIHAPDLGRGRAPRSSGSTSTSSSAAGATTRGARPRRGRTSSTRSPSRCATTRTTASAASACRSRCSRARTRGSRRPPTRRRRARRR